MVDEDCALPKYLCPLLLLLLLPPLVKYFGVVFEMGM